MIKMEKEVLWDVPRRHEGEKWQVFEVCKEHRDDLEALIKRNGFGAKLTERAGKLMLRFPAHDGKFLDIQEGNFILMQDEGTANVCMSICFDKQMLMPVEVQEIMLGGV
jgi:hypothetical protein